MGLDKTTLEFLLLSKKYINISEINILSLGRQQIHINQIDMNYLFKKYNLTHLIGKFNIYDYSENFFKTLFNTHLDVDSIDNSTYESATIIHNMNVPIKSIKKYQYVFDGGTIEHIFNIPQVIENIINLLEVGGLFVSVTCNNNFSGHGMYQLSPEFFLSSLNEKYGMKIECLYIGKVNTEFETWIDVNDYKNGRNCSKFDGNEPVYILTIARKISNPSHSLIFNSPNQYSYESGDWKKY
jgi:hypothetical protein